MSGTQLLVVTAVDWQKLGSNYNCGSKVVALYHYNLNWVCCNQTRDQYRLGRDINLQSKVSFGVLVDFELTDRFNLLVSQVSTPILNMYSDSCYPLD